MRNEEWDLQVEPVDRERLAPFENRTEVLTNNTIIIPPNQLRHRHLHPPRTQVEVVRQDDDRELDVVFTQEDEGAVRDGQRGGVPTDGKSRGLDRQGIEK